MPSEAWLLLTRGDVVSAILSALAEPMGYWSFVLIFAGIEVMLFIKTDSVTTPLIVSMFASALMMFYAPAGATAIPQILFVATGLFVVSTAGIIWKIWKGK